MAHAQSFYLGVHYHFSFDPFDPFFDSTKIEQTRYAGKRESSTDINEYDVGGRGPIIGYRGFLFQELSVEIRRTEYSFAPKLAGKGRALSDNSILFFGRTPLFHLRDSFFGAFFAGGGRGNMDNDGPRTNMPNRYNSETFLAGFEFYSKLSEFSYTPHRFFVEYVHVKASSKLYEHEISVANADNTVTTETAYRSEDLLTNHVTFGYSYVF